MDEDALFMLVAEKLHGAVYKIFTRLHKVFKQVTFK